MLGNVLSVTALTGRSCVTFGQRNSFCDAFGHDALKGPWSSFLLDMNQGKWNN